MSALLAFKLLQIAYEMHFEKIRFCEFCFGLKKKPFDLMSVMIVNKVTTFLGEKHCLIFL